MTHDNEQNNEQNNEDKPKRKGPGDCLTPTATALVLFVTVVVGVVKAVMA